MGPIDESQSEDPTEMTLEELAADNMRRQIDLQRGVTTPGMQVVAAPGAMEHLQLTAYLDTLLMHFEIHDEAKLRFETAKAKVLDTMTLESAKARLGAGGMTPDQMEALMKSADVVQMPNRQQRRH